MAMSKEQIEEHRLRMYAHKHRKLFQATMDHPELLEKCKKLIQDYGGSKESCAFDEHDKVSTRTRE